VAHLLEPQREKPLADGVLVVVVAPAGVSLEQFPDPYRRPFPGRAALLQEVAYHVHFPAVFVRGVQNSRRGGKPLPLPPGGAFQKPVENAARLGPQLFLKPPVLPFLGYPHGKRYQLDPPPYPVIGTLDHRLVVRRHENLERRHEVEELPVQKTRRHLVVSGDFLDQRLRKPPPLFRLRGRHKPRATQPRYVI